MTMEIEPESIRSAGTRRHAKTLLLAAGLVLLVALGLTHRLFRADSPASLPTASPSAAAPATP